MATPAACCPVLVERDRELAVLARVAREVADGISQLIILSGEAGAGKSRLAAEFIGSLGLRWRVITLGHAQLTGLMTDGPTPVAAHHHEQEMGARLAEALRSSEPTVVLVEDVHDLDPTLIVALGVNVELLGAAPVLLVATVRTGDGAFEGTAGPAVAELRRDPRVLELPIGPLSASGVSAMSRALGLTLTAEGVADVVRRSGGNAFFAEELLLASDASLSWTVMHTVLERVRAVGPAGRQVAELLAVGGTALPRDVVETTAHDGAAGVTALIAAGIAVTSSSDDIALRHALVGEVVETHLSLAERIAWHRTLATRLAEGRHVKAADIARHWQAAGDAESAARWAIVAADEALAARTFVTASRLYTDALRVAPPEPLAHAELLERAAIAAGWAGDSSTAFIRATLADARYAEGGEAWRAQAMWLNPTLRHLPKPVIELPASEAGDVASLLVAAERSCLDREYTQAAALARQALHVARRAGTEPSWEAEAAYRLVRCGALAEGEIALNQRLVAATVSGDLALIARYAAVMTEVALTSGSIDRANSYHRQAMSAADRLGQPYWALEVGQALLDVCRGDLDDAQQRLDRLFAERVPIAAEFAQLPAAWVDLERGNLDQVEARILRMGGVRTIGVATFTMAVCLIRARWRERLSDPRGALEALDEADRVNGDLFEPGRPDRLILRARVASRLGDSAMISEVHRDLRDLMERGGGGIISAGAEWAQGLRAERTGQARDARRRLQAAADKCEQASRFVLAVEAWCDLAAAARSDDERDIRRLAIESGRRIARGRGFVALLARLDELAGDDSGETAWPPLLDVLTPRQRDIALLVAAGRTNRQIGQQLYLSEHTVRNQLVDVFIRLGVERRAEIGALIHSTQPARS